MTVTRYRRRGFTLVELLVTVGLIAVLIGVLLSALSHARAASRRTRCLANLRQLAAANAIYAAEFPGWTVPAFWGWSASNPPWPPNTPPAVPASGPRLHWFQAWPVARALNATRATNGRYAGDLLCPDATLAWERGNAAGYPLHHSYGINRTQMPGLNVAGAPHYWNAWKAAHLRNPAEKIQFVDATSASVSATGSFNATMRYFQAGWGERHEAPDKTNIVAYRHHRGANVLYHDGHAQWSRHTELRYDPATSSTAPNRRQWEPKRP